MSWLVLDEAAEGSVLELSDESLWEDSGSLVATPLSVTMGCTSIISGSFDSGLELLVLSMIVPCKF